MSRTPNLVRRNAFSPLGVAVARAAGGDVPHTRPPAGECVLVDCLTLWLTATLDAVDAWARADAGERVAVAAEVDERTDALLDALGTCPAAVVLVSNEVGLGVVPASASGRLFADLLGRLNARVAAACDDVSLLVAGQVLSLPSTRPGAS